MPTSKVIAAFFLMVSCRDLDERAKKVAWPIAARKPIARNVAKNFIAKTTFGQHTVDAVAFQG